MFFYRVLDNHVQNPPVLPEFQERGERALVCWEASANALGGWTRFEEDKDVVVLSRGTDARYDECNFIVALVPGGQSVRAIITDKSADPRDKALLTLTLTHDAQSGTINIASSLTDAKLEALRKSRQH